MTLTIRAATPEDDATLARLSRHLREPAAAAYPDRFKVVDDATVKRVLDDFFWNVVGSNAWLALVDNKPAGYLITWLHHQDGDAFTEPRTYLEICQLVVDPEYRRQGVARALVDNAASFAGTFGYSELTVKVHDFNMTGLAAFEAMGFKPHMIHLERPVTTSAFHATDRTDPSPEPT